MLFYKNHYYEPYSVESCLNHIVAIGFDYDHRDNNIENMKGLVDELVELAKKGLNYLDEGRIHQTPVYTDENFEWK